jgi:hypothetical protein
LAIQGSEHRLSVDLELASELVSRSTSLVGSHEGRDVVCLKPPLDLLGSSNHDWTGTGRHKVYEVAYLLPLFGGVQVASHDLHSLLEWIPPKAQDFLGFRAVSTHSDGVIHRVYGRFYGRVIKTALRSVTQVIPRHPGGTLVL